MTQDFIKKWKSYRKNIINPDNASWKDLGFDKKPKEYKSVDDYLEAEGEFDEGQQTSLVLIAEFIKDLEKIEYEAWETSMGEDL